MSSVNKVILVGRLGKDPEVRDLENGAKVANFTMATSEKYKDKQGATQEITEWHNIVVWRGLAEVAQKYLTKGKLIYVEGKLRTRNWDDKDGIKRYTTEIVADNFTMLGSREDGGGSSNSGGYDSAASSSPSSSTPSSSAASSSVSDDAGDDLPF